MFHFFLSNQYFVKSIFIASLLLIQVIIQRWLAFSIFKIAISLRFIDIINKSWHLLHTYDWNSNPLFKKCQKRLISHSFDSLVLLTSIPSETSILSKYSILILFLIFTDIHLIKRVDNICYFHEKQLEQLLPGHELLSFYLELTRHPN